MGIGTQKFFFYFLFLLVEGIAHVLPHLALHIVFHTLLVDDADYTLFLGNITHSAQRTVHPTLLLVVLYEYNLSTRFQLKFHGGRERTLGKVALDGTAKNRRITLNLCQTLLISIIYGVATGSECDGEASVIYGLIGSRYPGVEGFQICSCSRVVANTVEDGDETIICLAIHLAEFNRYDGHRLPHLGIKEIGRGVEGLK